MNPPFWLLRKEAALGASLVLHLALALVLWGWHQWQPAPETNLEVMISFDTGGEGQGIGLIPKKGDPQGSQAASPADQDSQAPASKQELGFLKSLKKDQPPEEPTPSQAPPGPNQQAGQEQAASAKPGLDQPQGIAEGKEEGSSEALSFAEGWKIKNERKFYRATLARIVKSNWVVPMTAKRDFQIWVACVILPDGSLASSQVVRSGGLPILDQAAQRAILLSKPFPPFPGSMRASMKEYKATFRFTPDQVGN